MHAIWAQAADAAGHRHKLRLVRLEPWQELPFDDVMLAARPVISIALGSRACIASMHNQQAMLCSVSFRCGLPRGKAIRLPAEARALAKHSRCAVRVAHSQACPERWWKHRLWQHLSSASGKL